MSPPRVEREQRVLHGPANPLDRFFDLRALAERGDPEVALARRAEARARRDDDAAPRSSRRSKKSHEPTPAGVFTQTYGAFTPPNTAKPGLGEPFANDLRVREVVAR